MELSDKEKNDLRRFSLILNSMNMEDGVYWTNRYYEDYGYEQIEGPYYKNKNVESEISFLPGSIENLFKNILDNFDTDLFYNDYYDSYNGGVIITLNAIKKNLEVEYYYYSMEQDIWNAGAEFIDNPVVIDGNLITSPHYKWVGHWMGGIIKTYNERKNESY